MKFIKLLSIVLVIIGSAICTDETKFKLKKTHSKKSKSFLHKVKSRFTDTPSDGVQTFDQNSDLAKSTNILDMVPDQEASVIDLKLGPGPVHFQGWIKYFKFDSDESQSTRPTNFFKNNEFYQQSRKFPDANLDDKEEGEYKYIRNEMYFYGVLNYDSINILTSKIQKFQQTYDTLNIDLITPQIEDRNFKGGITDFGSFSEGFCFRVDSSKTILTELPKADATLKSWIFCTETAVNESI